MSNNFRFIFPRDDQYINLPLEIKWDFTGRDDSIELYEDQVLEDLIGTPNDFEILRFSHQTYFSGKTSSLQPIYATKIQYQFNFFSGLPITVTASTSSRWVSSYLDTQNSGFSPTQVYYYTNPFTRSFFKLDFYDSNSATSQTNYFTVILPVQQGLTESVSISPFKPKIDIKIPTMNLDFVGNKEGFFFYWLRKRDFLDINTFYVSAKFFDARKGEFIRMMNIPQSSLQSNKFIFDTSLYFYYKVVLDYNTKTYRYFLPSDNLNLNRLGMGTPIKWYEFVNP